MVRLQYRELVLLSLTPTAVQDKVICVAQGDAVMANKTGDARTDYLIDQNSREIRKLEKLADEKAAKIDTLIKRIHESRDRRHGKGNG